MKDTGQKYDTINYHSYLGLDQLLGAQNLRSVELDGKAAHDEMLFIIVHQAYELWFKQIIFELESVLGHFRADDVDERKIGTDVARLNRIIQIQQLLIDQIAIMETMTPLDFLDFRNYLFPASGFQSFQFRMVENLLGLQESTRLTYNGAPYYKVFTPEQQEALLNATQSGSLFDAVEDWLERTPFIELGDFDFLDSYKKAVDRMLEKEQKAILSSPHLDETEKEMRLKMLGNTDTYFESVLNRDHHEQLRKEGQLRLSYDATVAALFINLYREQPILQLPFQLLTCFIEIDQGMTRWRYRHAQMVLRMLGNKVGTGGSSGHDYLRTTAQRHHIFKDLHNISTLLIPRSELPDLPPEVIKALGFYFTTKS